jgi:hypothetical protein
MYWFSENRKFALDREGNPALEALWPPESDRCTVPFLRDIRRGPW